MPGAARHPADTAPSPAQGEGGGIPLYLQIAGTLRTAILRGIYPVGGRLPTEDELCRHFAVSRHTIREALRQLRSEGMIASRPGSRPVVAAPTLPDKSAFFADEGGFDYMIGTRLDIASMDMVDAGTQDITGADLPPGTQWLRVCGYRAMADSGQVTCWNTYLVAARYATVGRLLRRHIGPVVPLLEDLFDERIVRITRFMSAIELPAEHAAAFGCKPASPALRILTRCETGDGAVALLNQSIHPAGTISYTIRR